MTQPVQSSDRSSDHPPDQESADAGAFGAPRRHRRGFSLPELVMVLSITAVLASLLFPALSTARERANRAVSANNLRSIGLAVTMYDADFRSIPSSEVLRRGESPSELTLLFSPEIDGSLDEFQNARSGWDGLGQLWQWGYIDAPSTFFAPHRGESLGHESAVDGVFWRARTERIDSDYHYGGHIDWQTGKPRFLTQTGLVIASDTIRRSDSLNHEEGMNLVRSDGSVSWLVFPPTFVEKLADGTETPEQVRSRYLPLWAAIEGSGSS